LLVDHGELPRHHPVVVVGVCEVEQHGALARDAPVAPCDVELDAVREQAVKRFVLQRERRLLSPHHEAQDLVDRVFVEVGVEPTDGRREAPGQDRVRQLRPFLVL